MTSGDLADNSVNGEKIDAGAVSTDTIADGAVTSSKLSDPIYFAVVNQNGTLDRGSAGVTSSRLNTSSYEVLFPADISGCAYLVNTGSPGGGYYFSFASVGSADVPNGVRVTRANNMQGASAPFHLGVIC